MSYITEAFKDLEHVYMKKKEVSNPIDAAETSTLNEAWSDHIKTFDKDPEVKEEAESIIKNFSPKVLRVEKDSNGGSVQIGDKNSDFTAWVDVWGTDETDKNTDWNQYIFTLYDRDDCLQKLVQADNNVADLAFSAAIEALNANESINETASKEEGELFPPTLDKSLVKGIPDEEKNTYDVKDPIGVYPMSNWGGIEVFHCDDDYVISAYNFGTRKDIEENKIEYDDDSRPYFMKDSVKVYLDEVQRV